MASAGTVVEAFLLVLVFIGALSGNVMLFYIVAKVRNLQTKGNVFILNLAAADLLVSAVNLPITIVTVIAEDWIMGRTVCLISGFITLLTFVASCMALSMISINRYHAIVCWTSYESTYTKRKCALYVCITWAITIALSLPPFFGWARFDYDPGQSYCFAEWTASKSYTIFMISACLMGPLSVMSYCYVKIIRFHNESTRDVITASMSSTVRATTTTLNVEDPQLRKRPSKKRLTRTIITLIVVFGFCWSPFALIMIVQVFSDTYVPRAFDFGSLLLGYLNSFLNVIVYNVTNGKIRKEYKKILTAFNKKSQQSLETTRTHSVSASVGNYI